MEQETALAQIPNRIKIGPYTYTISLVDVSVSADEGVLQPHEGRLFVNRACYPDRQREILLHEIIHAAWDLVQLGDKRRDEEEVARRLATPLLQILRDNPKMVAFLTSQEESELEQR